MQFITERSKNGNIGHSDISMDHALNQRDQMDVNLCNNCVNCVNCRFCTQCVDCTNCSECTDCNCCWSCYQLLDSNACYDCTECSGLQFCVLCQHVNNLTCCANDSQVSADSQIQALDEVRAIVLSNPHRLDMTTYHGDDGWWPLPNAKLAKLLGAQLTQDCGTTHCIAGWLHVLATEHHEDSNTLRVASNIAPIILNKIYVSTEEGLRWLVERQYAADLETLGEEHA